MLKFKNKSMALFVLEIKENCMPYKITNLALTGNSVAIECNVDSMRHSLVGREGCPKPLVSQAPDAGRHTSAVDKDFQVSRTGLASID